MNQEHNEMTQQRAELKILRAINQASKGEQFSHGSCVGFISE
jgi:hypothetical protein